MQRLERLQSRLRWLGLIAHGAFYAAYRLRDGIAASPALVLEEHARNTPAKIAIAFEDQRISYGGLNARANQVAHALAKQGIGPGDAVALVMENRPEYLITLCAASKLGAIASLINIHLTGKPLEHALRICNAKAVLVGGELVENLESVRDALPVAHDKVLVWNEEGNTQGTWEAGQDFTELCACEPKLNPLTGPSHDIKSPFLYIYTSGTTGLPKAALTNNQRFLRAANLFSTGVLKLTPDDVIYTSGMPFYHGSGTMLGWGIGLAKGITVAMRRRFSAKKHWEDCTKFGATLFTYVGEVCRYLQQAPPGEFDRKHKLRAIYGAGLRPEIWEDFTERFGIGHVYEFYGATEGNVGIVNLDSRPGMLGRMMPGQAVVRADPDTGEVQPNADGLAEKVAVGECGLLLGRINRINRFDGYVDRGKNRSKVLRDPLGDGFDYFNTGDMVELHDAEFVAFADRMGDTFRWKGENVSTNEVQAVINLYEQLQESTVYGVKVPGTDGRAGMAAIVASSDFDPQGFGSYVDKNLPKYARPIFLRLVPKLETTGSYKYIKTHLQKEAFDPSACSDRLLFRAPSGRYEPLDQAAFEQICSGGVRV